MGQKKYEAILMKYISCVTDEKVEKVIKELTEKDYDRELLDDTDRNEDGKRRYEINCMYEVKLQNGEIINAYEDEINPNYCGDYEA